jgi:hypothetical protein
MNPHFVEILSAFHDEGVEFLVIGAHALAVHGHVRATLDIDLWVKPTLDNAARIWRALERFRAPLSKMKLGDFAEPDQRQRSRDPKTIAPIATAGTVARRRISRYVRESRMSSRSSTA